MALPEYNELSTTELEGMLRQSTAPEERNAISQELSRRYANGAVGQAPAAQPSPAHAAQPGVAMTQPTLAAAAPPLAADDTSPDLAPAARTGTERTGKMIASVVAAIIGILFIIAGFIYLAVPADSVPSIMGRIAGSTGHHPLRAAGCLIVGVVLLVAAWFVLRYQPKARNSGGAETNSPAG